MKPYYINIVITGGAFRRARLWAALLAQFLSLWTVEMRSCGMVYPAFASGPRISRTGGGRLSISARFAFKKARLDEYPMQQYSKRHQSQS